MFHDNTKIGGLFAEAVNAFAEVQRVKDVGCKLEDLRLRNDSDYFVEFAIVEVNLICSDINPSLFS